ncbi:hypothetical protein RFI_11074 [Reticulomyxa filosa]|uniref:Uncharacterized protein n=1 Tax=Reticulomyxa filosa TaxID=46433 RepID=X6NIB1_RETFI|nr:hypothetical protein RFI_11074 [Reticulomyxa filosa]|eukprot:ETO26060.1 hypothetical protein RFI_11074 [Reticulomyxa filosa]
MYHYLLELFEASEVSFLKDWKRQHDHLNVNANANANVNSHSNNDCYMTLTEWLSLWMWHMNANPKDCMRVLFAMGIAPTIDAAIEPRWFRFFTPQLRMPLNKQQRLFQLLVITNASQHDLILHQFLFDSFIRFLVADYSPSSFLSKFSSWRSSFYQSHSQSQPQSANQFCLSLLFQQLYINIYILRASSDLSPILEHQNEFEFAMDHDAMEPLGGAHHVHKSANDSNSDSDDETEDNELCIDRTQTWLTQRLFVKPPDNHGDYDTTSNPNTDKCAVYPSKKEYIRLPMVTNNCNLMDPFTFKVKNCPTNLWLLSHHHHDHRFQYQLQQVYLFFFEE